MSATLVGDGSRLGRAEARVIALSSFGGGLEFYDFIVYGVFAGYISTTFFPSTDPLVSLISTFSVFAGGYLVRPIGGLVLGHFGDRFGRRKIFLVSLLLMSVTTIGMGLVPGYAAIGPTATILFVLLRLVQGFCLGGEIPCAVTYIVEASPRRAGAGCGLLFCLAGMGVVVATGVSAAVHALLSPADAAAYGWRIAFVLGGVFGFVAYVIRGSLEESPIFAKIKQSAHRTPALDLVRGYLPQLVVGFGVIAVVGVLNGLLFVQAPAQLVRTLGYPGGAIANAVMLGVTALSVLVVAVGYLSDLVPRRWLHRAGALGFLAGAWPAYQALVTAPDNVLPVFVLAGVVGALTNGTFGVIAADLFPARVRFSGVAISYNVSTAIFQGLTPLVATVLIASTGSAAAPSLWLAAAAALAVVAGLWLRRFDGQIRREAGAVEPEIEPLARPVVAPALRSTGA